MNIYEGMIIAILIACTIMMISEYIDSELPKVCDVLQLMNILPCYEIKAFKNGKRLCTHDLVEYLHSPVKAYELKEGIFYIEIY